MEKVSLITIVAMFVIANVMFVSCASDDDTLPSAKEHDATLYGEWIAFNDGKMYIHDYYCFYEDGTGIHGSYEDDIDWINEDDDIIWFTVGRKYLYVNGVKYSYSCDGSTLHIGNKSYR